MSTTLPINFNDIALQSGYSKGRLFYSDTWKSWAVDGGDLPLALVSVPYNVGDMLEGKEITSVKVVDNQWELETEK